MAPVHSARCEATLSTPHTSARLPLLSLRPSQRFLSATLRLSLRTLGQEISAISRLDGAKHGWRVRLAGAEEPIPRLEKKSSVAEERHGGGAGGPVPA